MTLIIKISDQKSEHPGENQKKNPKHPREGVWRHHSAQQDYGGTVALANFMVML